MITKIQEIILTLLKTVKITKGQFSICTFATIMDILSLKKDHPNIFNKEIKLYDLKDRDFLKKLKIIHNDKLFLHLDGELVDSDTVDLNLYKEYDLITIEEKQNLYFLLIRKGSDQNMFSNWPKLLLFETIDLSSGF